MRPFFAIILTSTYLVASQGVRYLEEGEVFNNEDNLDGNEEPEIAGIPTEDEEEEIEDLMEELIDEAMISFDDEDYSKRKITAVKTDKIYQNEKVKDKEKYLFYSYEVPKDYDGVNDFLINVKPIGTHRDPDVFVSIGEKDEEKHPSNWVNSQYICDSFGKDSCPVNAGALAPKEVIYFAVRCLRQCVYNLNVEFIKENNLQDGKEMLLHMMADEGKILNFKVPSIEGSKDKSAEISFISFVAIPVG